mgnify:FL=1|tara:strand:- start:2406 stop:2837 length:432 start_codon:yes stop_codon:yes gene_type:complete
MVSPRFTTTARGQRRSIPEKPADFPGSMPEYIVFNQLLRLGLKPNVDFEFQARFAGGKIEKGGIVIDFLFRNPPNIAINVQGIYYHYEQGSVNIANDLLARQILAGEGISLIFLDEDDILNNPTFYVREALSGKDYSKFSIGR